MTETGQNQSDATSKSGLLAGTVGDGDLRVALAAALEEAGSQRLLAERAGVSQTMISLALQGHRQIRGRLLTFLGFEVQTFVASIHAPTNPKPDAEKVDG